MYTYLYNIHLLIINEAALISIFLLFLSRFLHSEKKRKEKITAKAIKYQKIELRIVNRNRVKS